MFGNLTLNDGFRYDPTSGILIGGNLLTFLLCLVIVGVIFAILAKPLKLATEFSDIITIGLLYAIACLATAKVKYIHGDMTIVSMLFNIISILANRVMRTLGLDSQSVILVTSFAVLLFNMVKNEFIINDIYTKLTQLKIIVQFLNTIGWPL